MRTLIVFLFLPLLFLFTACSTNPRLALIQSFQAREQQFSLSPHKPVPISQLPDIDLDPSTIEAYKAALVEDYGRAIGYSDNFKRYLDLLYLPHRTPEQSKTLNFLTNMIQMEVAYAEQLYFQREQRISTGLLAAGAGLSEAGRGMTSSETPQTIQPPPSYEPTLNCKTVRWGVPMKGYNPPTEIVCR